MKKLEYYLNLNYQIKIRKLSDAEGGGWFAEIPLLPGCMSDGETSQEAIENVNEAKKDWIEASMELGRPIPEPANEDYSGQLRVRMPKSLHRALSEKAREEKVSLNQFIIYQLSRGVGHKL